MNRIVRLTDANDTLADVKAIDDWAMLLTHLLAGQDVETVTDQMHRIAWQIVDHARAITIREEGRRR